MPMYQGYGPFPITVGGREFEYCFSVDRTLGQIDSVDGKFSAKVLGDTIHVWGSDFPGTSKKRPGQLTYRPTHLVVRSMGDAARNIIEWCLSRDYERE